MKRYYTIIVTALLAALFIYLFYRTEKTIINIMFTKLFGSSITISLRHFFKTYLPLPDLIVYSLPGALWVFSATLISRHLYVRFRKYVVPLCIFPMLYTVLLEFLQLTHFLPGTFDYIDIILAMGFGLLARRSVKCPMPVQHIFYQYSYRTTSLVYIYGIVFLSHVQR